MSGPEMDLSTDRLVDLIISFLSFLRLSRLEWNQSDSLSLVQDLIS